MITDFLKTKTSKRDLKTTLKVLREYKSCESEEEFFNILFSGWVKLEEFESFLEHLVEGKELED